MKNYTPAFVVFASSVSFFKNTAKKFAEDSVLLKNSTATCTPTFHLLSSIAFELLPKTLVAFDVCLKYKNETESSISQDDIINEIGERMTNYNHDLSKLYNDFPGLLSFLDIENINEFPLKKDRDKRSYFVWQYNFKIKGFVNEIMIKHPEGIKYGGFARQKDVATICVDDNKIIDILEKIIEYIEIKSGETKNILMQTIQ